jgi:hypothetical protein
MNTHTPVQLFSALPGAFNLTSLSDSSGVAGCGSDGAASTYSNLPDRLCPRIDAGHNFPRPSGRGLLGG